MREYRPARLPQRGGPVLSSDQRDCHLYRFYVRDPRTNYTTKTLGYIGETVRMPFDRLMEHVRDQPWADTIVGWEVDDVVYAGKDAVLAAERAAIHAELPLYNVEENLTNPERIPPWTAQEQRAARNAAGGRAAWQPAKDPQPYRPPTRPVAKPRRSLSSKWRRRRNTALAWLSGWSVATAVAWWLLAHYAPSLTVKAAATTAAIAVTLLCVVGPRVGREMRRDVRRVRRKASRLVGGVALAGLVVLALWLATLVVHVPQVAAR